MPLYSQEETVTDSFSIGQFSDSATFFNFSFKLFGDNPKQLIKKSYKKILNPVHHDQTMPWNR